MVQAGLDGVSEIVAVANPTESKLKDLPGPNEVHVCLDTILEYGINHIDNVDVVVELVDALKHSPTFSESISELLWKHQNEYVKVSRICIWQLVILFFKCFKVWAFVIIC